jgi:hypothetical protein
MGFLAFPSSLFIEHLNVPSYRQIVPNSVNETEIHWTFFGFEDDTPELAKLRLKQANLVGAAGYVLVEDAEVLAKQQRVMEVSPDMNHILEMGGDSIEPTGSMVKENALRAIYTQYREVMGF